MQHLASNSDQLLFKINSKLGVIDKNRVRWLHSQNQVFETKTLAPKESHYGSTKEPQNAF